MKKTLTLQILLAVILGAVFGVLFGKSVASWGEAGKAIIQLIKISATPLLFLLIVSSILKANITWRLGSKLLVVALLNTTIALAIGLMFSNIFQPGTHLEEAMKVDTLQAVPPPPNLSFKSFTANIIPESLIAPFVKNDVLTIVLLALVVGFALRATRKEKGIQNDRLCPDWLEDALRTVEVLLAWVVQLVPIAVFTVVAKSIGEYGIAPLKGLMSYVLVGMGGLLFHSVIVYGLWISRFAKISLKKFLKIAKEPIIYAWGVNSSLATLPVTLRSLKKLNVSDEAAALGAGVATNINNDGIILYEAMAILFLAQAHGIHLDLGQQIMAALTCLVAALGIAGIPEAGFVSLTVVVATLGLPMEYLPLILTVDWIVARGRSVVNVLSDMTLSIVVSRWEEKTQSR